MGKFKIHLKLQGLELDIEGDRSDMPAINNAVAREITGLIQPAAALTNGAEPPATPPTIEGEIDNGKKPRPRKRPSGSRSSSDISGQAVDFRHDPAKYGNPSQSWSVTQKAIWLIYVLKGIQGLNEIAASQLLATFNENFKQAKTIHPPHLSRDLGFAKVQNPAPVGEHKGMWYLTDEGERQAKELIQSVVTPAS
jgi:hypothetical protein